MEHFESEIKTNMDKVMQKHMEIIKNKKMKNYVQKLHI
jgi:ATP-dependent protease HslVU (ClpYQ) peptidase subunit